MLRRYALLPAVLSALLILGCSAASAGRDGPAKTPDPLDALPELPAVARPAPFELEQGMGATCSHPGPDLTYGWASPAMLRGECRGPMPRHMARAWRAIAPLLPRTPAVSADGAFERVIYRAVPGFGVRPDVVVDLGGRQAYLVLRSFEGRRPEGTVYAVWHDFCQREGDDSCPEAAYGRRVFRLDASGEARDVTAEVMPLAPKADALDLRMLKEHTGSGPFEDLGKLGEVSTTRWIAEYDPENYPPESYQRLSPEDPYAHFGFVTWNGERFELRERVPRALWPCARGYLGPCRASDDAPPGSPWIENDPADTEGD